MANFIINATLWTLALYGLIEILKTVYYAFSYKNTKPDGIYIVVAVKNQEERIEGFLRSILFRFLYGKEDNINDIIITDLNSKDNTRAILDKLSKDYDCISILNWMECKNLIDNIEETDVAKKKIIC